jgi:DNA-binding CsgD family transcriptional regulator
MLEGLNKETLERLYIKEGKSTNTIAKMFGCASMTVWTRCKKYGIKTKTRVKAKARGKRTMEIKKSVLQRLYVREGKSIDKIARMFSRHPYTVRMKCEQYGIEIKDHRIVEGLTESLLQKWYVKEGKSTREIGKIIGCSREPVRLKCKQFGIPLRPFAKKTVEIDKPTLHRLYIEEEKTVTEVASIFNCSTPTILRKARQYDIKLRPRGGKKVDIDESTLRRLYVKEGKSVAEIAKAFNCAVSTVSQRVKEFRLKKRA